MSFEILNSIVAPAPPQSHLYNSDIDALIDAYNGPTGVHTGGVVTAQGTPNMTVSVSAGAGRKNGRRFTWAANTSLAVTSEASPKFYLISVNTSGIISATAGTAAAEASVVQPELPPNSIPLAQVYLTAGDTTVASTQITSRRIVIPEPGHENVIWYGAIGNDSADNSPAFQLAINAIPTTFPIRGSDIVVPTGLYRFNSGLTFSSTSMLLSRFIGLGGMPGNAAAGGVQLKCNSASMTLFTVDAGASVLPHGPTFMNIGMDGQNLASTTLINIRMTNRIRITNCAFANATIGLRFDSSVDTIPGGDSSWHTIVGCTFYHCATSVEIRHSYGIQFYGCDIIGFSAASATGIRIGALTTGAVPTQVIGVFGMKIDACLIAIDIEGGYNNFYGVLIEQSGTAFRLRKTVANSISGSKNIFAGCGFGAITTGFDIGTGCINNTIIGTNFTTVTNRFIFADAAARAATIVINNGSVDPGNLRLATCATAAPADADLANGQVQLWWDAVGGAVKAKGKMDDGTVLNLTL